MDERHSSTFELAKRLVTYLKDLNLTIACAESLTGGDVCARLVDVPGAGDVLRGGVVSYATDLKHKILDVDKALLDDGGPVQSEVARQMARGVARLCDADIGVSTTGVAGPDATPDGPAGEVFIGVHLRPGLESDLFAQGLSLPGEGDAATIIKEIRFEGTRPQVREWTVQAVYRLVLESLGSGD